MTYRELLEITKKFPNPFSSDRHLLKPYDNDAAYTGKSVNSNNTAKPKKK